MYADEVNILGGSVHTIKENAEALIVASKEIGLEVNAVKTKYLVMSREQSAGRNRNMIINNRSFESVEVFKYLRTALINENSIQEEYTSRLKSGNDCFHSMQKLLISSLLSKNIKIKICRIIIFPVVLIRKPEIGHMFI